MKRNLFLAILLVMSGAVLHSQTAALTGYCSTGAAQAKTSGLASANYMQGIVPSCTVTVYLTGTTNKATIYSDGNNTPLGNSFTANADGSWLFFSTLGVGVDVTMSGGVPPNVFASPKTLVGLEPSSQFFGYPGVTTDSANGLILAGGVAAGKTVLTNGEYPIGTCTTSKTIDPANGNRQSLTLTAGNTCVLTFTQPASHTATVQLKITQDSTATGGIGGGLWSNGILPTITQVAGAVDYVSCYLDGTSANCTSLPNFQIPPANLPTFSSLTGTYNNDQSITISNTQAFTTMTYCTDSAGTCSPTTAYTAPVTVGSSGTHLRAKAIASQYTFSPIFDQVYSFQVASPTTSPVSGYYVTPQTVSLLTATTGATIIYCRDSINSCTPSTTYTVPLTSVSNQFVRMSGSKTGYTGTSVVSNLFTGTVGASHTGVCIGVLSGPVTSIPCTSTIAVTAGDYGYVWVYSYNSTASCPAGNTSDVTGLPGGSVVTVVAHCIKGGTTNHYANLYQVVWGATGSYTPAVTTPSAQFPQIVVDNYTHVSVGVVGTMQILGYGSGIFNLMDGPSITPTQSFNQIVTGFFWNPLVGESSVSSNGGGVASYTFNPVASGTGTYFGSVTGNGATSVHLVATGTMTQSFMTAVLIQ